MTERGLPAGDAPACPFVAFEDDRDERSQNPDHRHRCYAEIRPAPRALAHQEAYCLSSAFPVCPTFQDWARREAARSRPAPSPARAATAAAFAVPVVDDEDDEADEPADDDRSMAGDADDGSEAESADEPSGDDGDEFGPRRNPPRDWAAPPPWMIGSAAAAAAAPKDPELAELIAPRQPGAGLAGSTADRLAGGAPLPAEPASRPPAPPPGSSPVPPSAASSSASASPDGPPPMPRQRRMRTYDQHLGGPDWEPPRRYEAYPTIRTRMSLPALPRIAVMAGALALAAVALFFLPALLGVGDGGSGRATPTPSASSTATPRPTPTPAPTPQTYVIKAGDTLTKIAVANGLTLDELLAANPQIKNPNLIEVGDPITIPVPVPSEFSGSVPPSVEPSVAP